jgi:formate dehydrogenase iron-sulfur subunit
MSHVAIYFDASLCVECTACKVACNDQWGLKENELYLTFKSKETGKFPNAHYNISRHSCNHCQEAPCVEACPTGCLSKDAKTGMTKVELEKCSGCGYCETVCPYDSVWVENGHTNKCVGCLDRVEAGLQPACVDICPTDALQFGDREKLIKKAEARVAELKDRYPNANVFGKDQLGGQHLIRVLLEKPETFELNPNPETPVTMGLWKSVLQPLSIVGVVGAAAGVSALYPISRKNHLAEMHGDHDEHGDE